MADLRLEVLQQDKWSCRVCGTRLRSAEAAIDHIIPRRRFTRREKADEIDNLQSLCGKCHQIKTQEDRKGESRVQ